MKKLFVLMILASLACAAFSQSVSLGDANGNKSIDIVDALLIARYSAGLNPQGIDAVAADTDCSGAITITDALLVARYSAKLIQQFPCKPVPTPANKGLTIYYARHAETVANASGELGGAAPVEDHDKITDLGYQQMEALKDFLITKNIKPDIVLVSPTSRTQKTIEPYLLATGTKSEIWVALIECSRDEPTGAPLPTARPKPVWKFKVDIVAENTSYGSDEDSYYWFPNSFEEEIFMVMTARDRLLQRYSQSGKTILIIGHAVSGIKFLGLLAGYNMIDQYPSYQLYLRNTGLVKFEQDPASGKIKLTNMWVNNPPH